MDNFADELMKIHRMLSGCLPEFATEIVAELELLSETIDKCEDVIWKQEIPFASQKSNRARVEELLNAVKNVNNFKSLVENLITACEQATPKTDSIIEDEEDEHLIPNYKEYETDRKQPHSLMDENFTHKKICGFSLYGKYYEADYWKYAFKRVCEILYAKDSRKFINLVESNKFSGKKVQYISMKKDSEFYLRLHNTDSIYVWTNLSAMAICDIIKQLLAEFNIPQEKFSIYLRADYTPLHYDNDGESKCEMKIGKYVQAKLGALSDQGYRFEPSMLNKLLDAGETRKLFGIGLPFLKEVREGTDISTLSKDESGYNRYWIKPFRFNGKDYLVVSQWQKQHQERFDKWYSALPNV